MLRMSAGMTNHNDIHDGHGSPPRLSGWSKHAVYCEIELPHPKNLKLRNLNPGASTFGLGFWWYFYRNKQEH